MCVTHVTTVVATADREKLQQIVLNLLSNAVKFTELGGRVRVADCVRRVSAACGHVRTPGSGSRGASWHNFRAVRSGGRGSRDPHEGTGLGLAISRDLARGMGGELSATSAFGAGSTFTVILRRAARPAA